jgi:DNA polymerase III epsilon subunit family exonuclease
MQASLFTQASLFSSPVMGGDVDPQHTQALWATLRKTPVTDVTFTVIDLETTGLTPKRNSITEVTAIRYRNGQELAMFSSLIQPTDPIPHEVEELTGISNAMVATAPPLLMVLNDLAEFMGEAPVIVGHNVAFDLGFLREKAMTVGLLHFEQQLANQNAVCTRLLAKHCLPMLPSYEGAVVATQCGHYNANAHRAEADVRMAAAILFHLLPQVHPNASPCTLAQVLAIAAPKA